MKVLDLGWVNGMVAPNKRGGKIMELSEAIQLVQQGNSILLLGAGFSCPSKNKVHRNLPTGGQLATLLAAELGLPDKYPLAVVASRFEKAKGELALTAYLSETFSAESVTPDQERVCMLPWRRAYTLNYDNVVEKIYSQRFKSITSLNYDSPIRSTDGAMQYIHLHGELHSGNMASNSLVLGNQSYNTLQSSSGWFARFRNDIELADCVIAVGCSLSDLHISSLFFNDPVLQGKTFFVDIEDMDEVWLDNLSEYGKVEPIGLKKFADMISASPPPVLRA
ncbi:SIR2 family protein [Brevundimonas sp. TWP2-3-2]|uniref:SIR2 family protein n=1 Tax=unclassified Brevundimonas TaxID=2622653 RepID=UPI003CEBE86A